MDYSTVVSTVSSLGFPIVACGALFWMYNTSVKELKDTVMTLNITLTELITTVKALHGANSDG